MLVLQHWLNFAHHIQLVIVAAQQVTGVPTALRPHVMLDGHWIHLVMLQQPEDSN